MGSLYNRVKVNNPGHSFFNLSHDKKFDCDAGQLIPIDVQFCMPNDVLKFGNEIVARMNPLVAPIMHEVNVYTQYYFVPLRIMFGQMKQYDYPSPQGLTSTFEWQVNDHDFETFLTGGYSGYDTSVSLPTIVPQLNSGLALANDNYVHQVSWDSDESVFTNSVHIGVGKTLVRGQLYYYRTGGGANYFYTPSIDGEVSDQDYWTPLYPNEYVSPYGMYSLWDYLGFPVGVNMSDMPVSDFPFRAYRLIWNNFFRDQTLMDEVRVDSLPYSNMNVKNVCWNKDYFTSAYTQLQRGQSPALPLSNSLLPVFFDTSVTDVNGDPGDLVALRSDVASLSAAVQLGVRNGAGNFQTANATTTTPMAADSFKVDASGLFNVNDLRLAMRVQEWLEVNLRVGTHLNEFLIGHFGIGPNDETLQRPVYLGGSKSPVIVSEVLQTSQTTETESGSKTLGSPQGNMSGHGITADRNYIGSYRCKEFGIFMGVMYIRPKATYQQGVRKPWLYSTKYDFPFPEFAHLGMNAIFESEIFAKNTGNLDSDGNPVIFGYTERYNELRSTPSEVCGGLRSTFDFWHLGRIFDDAPTYNADFVRCVPDKRIFAVQSEPGFIVNVGNTLHAYRPIPTFGDPRT